MVDTSQLISNERDIFRSSETACFCENDPLMNLIISSPNKNILSKIFWEKTWLNPSMKKERELLKEDRCIIRDFSKLPSLFRSPIYLIGELNSANVILASLASLLEGALKAIWLNEKNLYEYRHVLYYNPAKPEIADK